MTASSRRRKAIRIALYSVIGLCLVVLIGVAIVLVPILTHKSAGGSGQAIPEGYVSQSSATGDDGRTRTLSAKTIEGKPADLGAVQPGEEIVVTGSGYDSGIGIYVSFCAIPDSPKQKPSPCLGGIPQGAEQGSAAGAQALASAWITDDWAWRSFATQGYDDAKKGSFTVRLTVPEPMTEGLDCATSRCALVTRSDHTASADRVQDMLLPIRYR